MSKIGKYLSVGVGAGAGVVGLGLEGFDDDGVALTVDAAPYDVVIPEVQPVSEGEFLAAQDTLLEYDEAIVIDRQDEIDTYEAVEEAQGLLASVEEFHSLLRLGKERGEFTQATAAAAIVHLDYVKSRIGDEGLVVPSLEDYSADNIEALYDTGLESFRGFANQLNNLISSGVFNVTTGLWSAAKSASRKDVADALTKAADLALEATNDGANYTWPAEKVSVPVSGLGKRFGQAGKFPGNVVQAVEQDLKGTNWMLTQYPKKAGEFSRKVSAGMVAVGNAKKGAVEDAARPYTKLALPGASVPPNLKDGSSLIGNVAVGVALEAEKTEGEGVAKELRKLVRVPAVIFKTKTIAADPSELKLGKAEVIKLCNAVKGYAQLILKADAEWEKEVKSAAAAAGALRAKELNGTTKVNDTITWTEGGVLDAMGDVLISTSRHLSVPFGDAISHAKQAADAALMLARRALDAAEV